MTNALDSFGNLFGNVLGRATAPIGALAVAVDSLGQMTEFTGEEIQALGELEQQLADVIRRARASLPGNGGDSAADTDNG